jgi:Holliday junction DNA helicase RuvA
MIDYIRGKIIEASPVRTVVETGGIGYELNITLIDFTAIQNKDEAKFYVHESIREDAHVLFGFLSQEEREMFRLLIGVSGVGPNTARLILSAMTAADLQGVISSENVNVLKQVKGIGGKTAQRIIVDLKDKINSIDTTLSISVSATHDGYDEAFAALTTLGFQAASVHKALKKIYSSESGIKVEAAIKQALKML